MPEHQQDGGREEQRRGSRRVRDLFASFAGEHQANVLRDFDRRRTSRREADRATGSTPPQDDRYSTDGAPSDPSRPTVLVVDDVEATRAGLAELLRLRGYNAVQAAHGGEGIEMLRAHPHIQAIILDLRMPHFDGFWFREQQLKDPAHAAIPIIVFTGSAVPPDTIALQLQVSDVLLKPFSVDRLFERVERHCATPHRR